MPKHNYFCYQLVAKDISVNERRIERNVILAVFWTSEGNVSYISSSSLVSRYDSKVGFNKSEVHSFYKNVLKYFEDSSFKCFSTFLIIISTEEYLVSIGTNKPEA